MHITPPEKTNEWAEQLKAAMSQFYQLEHDRADTLRMILNNAGIETQATYASGSVYLTDGHSITKAGS